MYQQILGDEIPMVPVPTLRHAVHRQERQDIQVQLTEQSALAVDRQKKRRDGVQVSLAE